MKILFNIIKNIYDSLKLQKICFKNNDMEEAEKISEEIIKWIEELQLDK